MNLITLIQSQLLLFISIVILSGCATNTVIAIGHRTEDIERYRSFTVVGNKLLVQYSTYIEATDPTPCGSSFYQEGPIAKNVQRWGFVDLDSGWSTPQILKGEGWWAGAKHSLEQSEGPYPELLSNNYVRLNPSRVPWFHQIRKEESSGKDSTQLVERHVQQCLNNSRYCINFPYGGGRDFVLLTREPESNAVQSKYISSWPNRYYEKWAKKVHYSLVPFSFVFDVVTLPLLWPGLICM